MANAMNDSKSRRDFVRSNHTCVISYTRKTAPPSMSIIHYAMDGDDVVFLTMAARQKERERRLAEGRKNLQENEAKQKEAKYARTAASSGSQISPMDFRCILPRDS